MLVRVKRWVEYNRVKTNPTNSQKHKNLHLSTTAVVAWRYIPSC